MSHDGTTAPLVVGMVNINCPACGDVLQVDVRVQSVSTNNGSYLEVTFQDEYPTHRCAGRRA